ncbi:MAG TPA: hypothetical protein VFM45_13005 [Anaeromyxobacteraceae bacterium]|nr:hypothetical protein [Anaeromyxobacteraceae bacterium]
MPIDLGDPLRWRETLPARQPMSSEVTAGAVSGIVGGAVAWGAAMAFLPAGAGGLLPLRLVAATLFGESALAPENVGFPAFVGALLVGLAAVTYGLVFVSILRPAAPPGRAIAVGAIYGAVLYVPAWLGVVHVFDPLLYRAGEGRGAGILAFHVLYGATMGFLVPFLRKVLP